MTRTTKNKIMKRPLFNSFIFLCLGIIFSTNLISLLFVAILCIAIFYAYKTKQPFFYFLLFIVGYFSVQNSLSVKNVDIDSFAHREFIFSIEGRVIDINTTVSGRQRLILSTRYFDVDDMVFAQNMRIQAILPEEYEMKLGQTITLTGTLNPLRRPSNPGGFDQFQFLRARKIQYTMFPNIVTVEDIPITTVGHFQNHLHNLRSSIIDVFHHVLPAREAGVITSIIVGDRTGLDPDIFDAYRAAGFYHILVISGLHLTILMLAVNKTLEKFMSIRASALTTLAFLIFYTLMVGSSVSTVRAVTMAGVMIFGKLFYRPKDFLTTISFAGMALLLYEPLYLFDIGFLLSFSAVFAIALGAEPIDRLLGLIMIFENKKFRQSMAVNIAIFLVFSPLFAYFFFHVQTYSLIANIFVILTANFLVVLGFLTALLGLISHDIAELLSGGLFFIIRLYEIVAMFFYNLPNALWLIGRPHITELIGYYALLGFAFYSLMQFRRPHLKKYFLLASFLYIGLISFNRLSYTGLQVTFLDVGQGEAIVITHGREVYLIDGGGLRTLEIGNNMGVRVLLPYLDYRGIRSIDTVFVTHEDSDHIIGIIEALGVKDIGKIYTTIGLDKEYELSALMLERAEKYNVPLEFISAGASFSSNSGISIETLYPFKRESFRTINATSLVFRLTYGDISFLFTGDIDQISEREILASGAVVSSDVLNVAHHGSRFSNYDGFIDAVDPLVAVISSGRNNPFGHPAPEVVEKFAIREIPLYNTADYGSIRIWSDGKIIKKLDSF